MYPLIAWFVVVAVVAADVAGKLFHLERVVVAAEDECCNLEDLVVDVS